MREKSKKMARMFCYMASGQNVTSEGLCLQTALSHKAITLTLLTANKLKTVKDTNQKKNLLNKQ